MQRIIDSILKKKDVLVFLILLLFSLYLIIDSNYYQKYKFINLSNNFVTNILQEHSSIIEYFKLKDYNTDLIKENINLKNEMLNNNYKNIDSVLLRKKFIYTDAKIISNNVSFLKNYLIINKGSKDGVIKEMGVTSPYGIIGIVNEVSENYSSIMSILNLNSKINAKVKRSNYFGSLEWEGLNTELLILKDIPKTANINVGDSIVSGGMSAIFPENIKIGVISKVVLNSKLDSYLRIEVKPHNDMSSIRNVYLIFSLFKNEIKQLKEKVNE
ncbi:MAG: rod shape-determining protein MreC [Bacteroidetes bacterium]|nr:rod shape-determining protein MreC [Bacteroidota bacterium]MDA1018949.1 rod shape-determining protein MreC [Bacteroidota bacterium]